MFSMKMAAGLTCNLAILVALSVIGHAEVKAQSSPCKTPTLEEGLCVSIEKCRNIFAIVSSSKPQRPGIRNYIARAECALPGIERSVCCQVVEVAPEPIPVITNTAPRLDASITISGKENLLPKDCGKSIFDRIAFGEETPVFAYPWMALLRYKKTNGELVDGCGGSLINSRYVLTAAHCVKTRSTFKLDTVRLGEHTRSTETDCNFVYDDAGGIDKDETQCADRAQDFKIETTVVHSDYNRPAFSNDIALIRLASEVTMQDHIKPICLPVTPALQALTFTKYIVTGWGTTENSTGSDVLLLGRLPFVKLDDCRERMRQHRLRITLGDKQMCAGGEKVDTCKGDSGGPLGTSANYDGAKFVQFGVVSAGIDSCGQKSVPGIYVHVPSYMDWILANIEA